MPFAIRDGVRLYWKLEGATDRPPLLLLNSIGTDLSLWDAAVPQLLQYFQLLRMDIRGHGASDAPAGDYALEELACDVLVVLEAAGIERTAIAGVSLGGMIAMEIALRAPERVSALALICTSAEMDRDSWAARVEKVRSEGTATIADLATGRFLSPSFASSHPAIAETIRRGLINMAANGYAGAAAAIRDMNLADRICAITAPTLVISGTQDVSTPPAGHGQRIASTVPAAEAMQIDCGHLAPVEAPAGIAAALIRFLTRDETVRSAEGVLRDAGMANRRRVLGDEWVDRSLADRTAFTGDFQELITRIAWHEIWGRPGLDERTRRLLVIAVTAALGRWEEFRLHVRTGIEQGGFSVDELKEVLLQLAIYAGVPAANTGFSEASEVLSDVAKAGAHV